MSRLPRQIFDTTERYKDLFDSAHDLIHLLEPDGSIMYVNHAWERNLGYREEEIRGRLIYSFTIPQDRARFRMYRESVLQGRAAGKEIIIGLLARNGDVIYAEGFVSPRFIDGQPVYTRGIFRDVTRRLRNEARLQQLNEELRERETNLQRLLFYAPDAIIVIDAKSIVQFWNPKAEFVFGWREEEVLGKSLTDLIIPPVHRAAHEAGMQRFLATGEARVLNQTIEITSLHKSGREFHVALTISSTSQKGEVAFIAFIRDIEEQKMNSRELERKTAELELSNRQLEQFAYVASHDMKEPVRKILMFTDRLEEEVAGIASEKGRGFLEKIRNAALRLSEMVEGVLANSTLKAEPVRPEIVDLNAMIRSIETDLEYTIEEKKAVVRYDGLPMIEGSPFLLFQLFYNLISNSLKFTRRGVNPVIEIHARRVLPSEVLSPELDPTLSWFEIVVRDNGIGFPQEESESIFKIFSRLNRKEEYEGTGMGLALCKSIVEKHHGFIRATGKEKEGAVFTIHLPERSHS